MGALCSFRCPACGYRAEVSGGDDCGLSWASTTIVCEDCLQLYDIVTGPALVSETSDHRKRGKFRCPKRPGHRIERWIALGPCPVCGTEMQNDGLAVLWD